MRCVSACAWMRTDPGHAWAVSWGCPGTTSPPPDLHIHRIAPGSGAGDAPLLRSAAATWAQEGAGAGAGSNRARAPIPSRPPDEVTVGRSGWRRRTGGIRSLGRFPRTDRRPRDPILGRGGFRTPPFDVTCCARAPPPRANPGIPRKDPFTGLPSTKQRRRMPPFSRGGSPKGGHSREAKRLSIVQGGRPHFHNWHGMVVIVLKKGKQRNPKERGRMRAHREPNACIGAHRELATCPCSAKFTC